MKKLHVKTESGWCMVFCANGGRILTTDNPAKALPPRAMWGDDDLKHFSSRFANREFKLAQPEQKIHVPVYSPDPLEN